MSKIPLTIDPGYVSSWQFFEGIRELLQNAKDADEYEGMKMEVEHLPRTSKLCITTKDAVLSPSLLLLLGATTKRDSDQRGKFGEGFALACLALVRAGHDVTVYNGTEVWRPSIEMPDPGHPFEGQQLLVFTTRKLREPRKDFTVEVENVSKDVWDAAKKLFLFLNPPKECDIVSLYEGSVLLNEEHKGKVFCRGIFVMHSDDLECGYDLKNLQLDRDRKSAEDWNLKYRLGALWNEATKKYPERFAPRVYKMVKSDKAEVKSIHYHADAKLLKLLREEFEAENGVDAIAVEDMASSRELEELGARTAVVNKTLMDLLSQTGPKIEDIRAKLKCQVKGSFSWTHLTQDEGRICTNWIERVTKDYIVVTFYDPTVKCSFMEDQGKIGISRDFLTSPLPAIVLEVAKQEAKRRGSTTETVLAEALVAR